MPLTSAQVAEKWQRNYSASAQSFEEGINAITQNPMEKAIASKDKMIQKWTAAINNGKWEAGLRSIGLAEWKAKTIRLGKQRMAEGAKEGMNNTKKFFDYWLPITNQLRDKIATMPNASKADRRARLNAAFDFLSEQQYTRR